MSTWVEQAITKSLEAVPLDNLIDAAADHVKVRGEWPTHTISPSLLADSCRLSRVKRFMGHNSQPGEKTGLAVRAGRPSAETAINFARGYMMEGLLVAALKQYPGIHPVKDENDQNMVVINYDAWEAYKIIGCSPSLVFRYESTPPLSAHPDVVVNYCGETELIQIKCPSVKKFDRIERNGDTEFDSYIMQLSAEMYFGKLAGYDIQRTHLLMASFEGRPYGKGGGIRTICRTWDWHDDMAAMVDAEMQVLMDDYAAAMEGHWPEPFPAENANKFPCSYCNYSRVDTVGLIGCTQQEKWKDD